MSEALIKAQGDLATKIANTWTNITKKGKAKATAGYLNQRLALLRSDMEKFENGHRKVMELAETDRTDYHWTLDDVEESFCICAGAIEDALNPTPPAPTVPTGETGHQVAPQQTASASSNLTKLARLDIPVFNGDWLEWPKFKGLFESLIHNNAELPKVVKLQHLISHLKGEAAELIESVVVSNEGYDGAWKDLVDMYENHQVLLFEYMRNLISCPAVTRPSAAELKRVSAVARRSQRAFKVLKRPVEAWSDWLLFLTVEKLDAASKLQWQSSLPSGNQIPTFEELLTFLENRIRGLAVSQDSSSSQSKDRKGGTSGQKSSQKGTLSCHTATSNAEKKSPVCSFCSKNHTLSFCFKFKKLNLPQRLEHVRKTNACFNCLHSGHSCAQCPSAGRCHREGCNEPHHTLLHQDSSQPQFSSTAVHTNAAGPPDAVRTMVTTVPSPTLEPVTSLTTNTRHSTVLLATAIVTLEAHDGHRTTARALLDPASESSFISERIAQLLRLKRERVTVPVFGLQGSNTAIAHFRTALTMKSQLYDSFSLSFSALILPQLSSSLPPRQVHASEWTHLAGLELADPNFAVPARIDMLLGADVYGALILGGVKRGPAHRPVALETVFGWVLLGPTSADNEVDGGVTSLHCRCEENLNATLRRFWELEEISNETPLSKEDEWCEQLFSSTHTREEDGRYKVNLPLRPDNQVRLGNSSNGAQRLFMATERKLMKNPALAEKYRDFMSEYIALGHMEVVEDEENVLQENFLPHHSVERQDGKIRVVFNASYPTTTGASLNDKLVPGCKLQPELWVTITRWRMFRVPFKTDNVKMYRQIKVHEEHQRFQMIWWRPHPNQRLQRFRLTTVTYGTAPAPYLALRTQRQLADDEQHRFPKGAQVIRENTYIDDVYAGADDLDSALQLREEVVAIFEAGQFPLAKWASTHPELCPDSNADVIDLPYSESVSTLGLCWNPRQDFFSLKVEDPPSADALSKRQILSAVAKLFDPLGWVGPVVITAKILMQDLWLANVGWDEPIPREAQHTWKEFCTNLPALRSVKVPRWVSFLQKYQGNTELHGFADASQRAYAACVYLRIVQQDSPITVSLLVAKTKVAPVKAQTVPRLELCAAVLLTTLIIKVRTELKLQDAPTYAWTDSQVVLAWLRGHASKWPTFVSHRVAKIQAQLPSESWRYVHTKANPADLATRGLTPQELIQADLWWKGPAWLQQLQPAWPNFTLDHESVSCLLAVQPDVEAQTATKPDREDFCIRFSSLERLLTVATLCLRWRSPKDQRSNAIHVSERAGALTRLLLQAQQTAFGIELECITKGRNLPRSSLLKNLRPFQDEQGLVRVGGRLHNASLPYNERHPIIIPKNAHITRLLIHDAHHRTLHGGPQLVRSFLEQRYWIIKGHSVIRQMIQSCVRCARFSGRPMQQIMGELPSDRVNPSPPFSKAGVDYAGPITLKTFRGRGAKTYKGYICLFVCLCSRAIHLEAVSDLTSQAFIAAFRRFISRRGLCRQLLSDNGTTFRGADKELRALFNAATSFYKETAHQLAKDGTDWKFIPPYAPHFGGLWEAGVKSTKYHLRRVIGDQLLTFEELATVLAQIEACLNSRPLSALSNDPQSFAPLTPGHLLIGRSLAALPEPGTDAEARPPLNSWHRLSRIRDDFWRRWSKEYLLSLRALPKWTQQRANPRINDLVLLVDDLQPPSRWSLGRITQIHPGSDENVRVATLRTQRGETTRPTDRLCLLPCEPGNKDEEDDHAEAIS